MSAVTACIPESTDSDDILIEETDNDDDGSEQKQANKFSSPLFLPGSLSLRSGAGFWLSSPGKYTLYNTTFSNEDYSLPSYNPPDYSHNSVA